MKNLTQFANFPRFRWHRDKLGCNVNLEILGDQWRVARCNMQRLRL